MGKDVFDALLARMASSGVVTAADLKSCTQAEIRRLEARYKVRLPAAYERFLKAMGHRSGRLFTHDWVDTDYPYVLEATAELRGLLAESAPHFELPADALVILGRDGEQFNFIRCDRPEDSAVWALDLGATRVRGRRFRPSVLGWVRAWAAEAAEVVASGWYEGR
jgi:hypothetical protein